MSLICAGGTDIGKKRSINQDSIYLSKELLLFIVADGMGGHNGGDTASKLAIEQFPLFIKNNCKIPVKDLLPKAIEHINNIIYDTAQENSMLQGMGTTIVSMFFKDSSLYLANVGDSRAYLINNKKIYQLTKDHSLVQEKINLQIYNREEGKKDKQKNILIRTIGYDPKVESDIYSYKVNRNDIFLICSDGLHGRVSDEDILFIINNTIPPDNSATDSDIQNAVTQLINLANNNGGNDNISLIIAMAK